MKCLYKKLKNGSIIRMDDMLVGETGVMAYWEARKGERETGDQLETGRRVTRNFLEEAEEEDDDPDYTMFTVEGKENAVCCCSTCRISYYVKVRRKA